MTAMIGREDDLARVLDVLDRRRACAVVAPDGMGKSTLLRAAASTGGDAVVAVDARSSTRAGDVLIIVLEALDADHEFVFRTSELAEACTLIARRIAAAGVRLLVIDHVDHDRAVLLGLLEQVIDKTDVNVLVASRSHLREPFGEIVRLGPLPITAEDSPALDLFAETFVRSGGRSADLTSMPDAVSRLVELTGGIPLALVVAAAHAAMLGPANSLEVMGSRHRPDDGDPVIAALESSLTDLDARCLQVFEAAGCFRSKPSLPEIAQVCGTTTTDVAHDVDQLARRCLVEFDGGRVSMLPPVRQLAEASAARNGREHTLRERRDEWAYTVSTTDPPLATRTIVAIEDDLAASVASTLRGGRLDEAAAIAATLDDSFRADLRHHRRLDVLEPVLDACRVASIDATASPRFVERTIEMLRLAALARSDVLGASSATTLLDEAGSLTSRSEVGGQHTARLNALRAGFSFESGDLTGARAFACAGRELARDSGDDRAKYVALKMLADVELETGNLGLAIELANEIVREAPSPLRWLRAYALATVGACELERGAIAVTVAAATAVAREAREVGDLDLVFEADWLTAMADPRSESAIPFNLDGDRLGRSTIHIQADIARCLRRLAAGDARSAITLAADCELRANATPMQSLVIDARLLVGSSAVMLGELTEAKRAFAAALTDAARLGYRLRVPDALDGLADIAAHSETGRDQHQRLHAAASLMRHQLGSVARPAPWRPPNTNSLGVPPQSWVDHGTITPVGLETALRTYADHDAQRPSPLDVLSPAERAVADLVAAGCSNREIGEQLYVSRRTVESHISHAFQKLGLSSRTQLATLGVASR